MNGIQSPILMYHAIAAAEKDPNALCVSPQRFEAQMAYLKQRNLRGVSVRELRRAAATRGTRGLVGLTFDDGYDNFLQEAVPVLESAGFSATVYVVGGMLGAENSWDPIPRMKLLGADGVREVSARGMEVGSHSMSHARLHGLGLEALELEVGESRRVLSEVTGETVEGFCYPYGSLDSRAIEAVRKAGYSYACAYKERVTRDDYDLPRAFVGERDGALRLAVKLLVNSKLHWTP